MTEAIEKARVARLQILGEMAKTLAEPRTEISKYAPRIETIKINPEKIGAIIGPGGKNIKKLVEESGCEIDIEDDGTVNIFSVTPEGMKIARDAIHGHDCRSRTGKDLPRQGCHHQGIRRVRRIPARQGRPWSTSANWPTSASRRPRTSSKSATKSPSNAWAWTKKAVCDCHARPRWPSATPKWPRTKRRINPAH